MGRGYESAIVEVAIPLPRLLPALSCLALAACGLGRGSSSGGSLAFDGVDDYVALDVMPGLPSSGWTVEAWVRPEPGEQQRPNIAALRSPRGGAVTFTYRIRQDFGGVLELGLASGGDTWGMAGNAPIPLSRWSHVAATWDGATSTMRLFVDGRLDAERTTSLAPAAGIAPLWLGGDPLHGPTGRPFTGSLTELRIWDHARSTAQLTQLEGARLQGDEAGLVLYWPALEGSGAQLTDHGPTGLHGSLGAGQPDRAPRWERSSPF